MNVSMSRKFSIMIYIFSSLLVANDHTLDVTTLSEDELIGL